MGTPHFALPALKALQASAHELIAVYSQPPRPSGRGMAVTPSPVHAFAEEHAIPVFTPEKLSSAEAQAQFRAHEADIAVVAAYGLLLPQAILDAPRFGCLNIHPSDLPRWRGAAPIQRTLMAGDTATACCIMRMEAGLDTGPVLAREPYVIPQEMDGGALHDAMAERGAALLLKVIEAYADGCPPMAIAQHSDGVTYAKKITKADQIIHWNHEAHIILNQIRGLSPSPGAITMLNGETVKLFAAQLEVGDASKPPGEILDNALLINAAHGTALRILHLQRPGKTRQKAADFLQGFQVFKGNRARQPTLA